MLVSSQQENLLEFILDKPDLFNKLKESSDPFSKDILLVLNQFKITEASTAFKEDNSKAFTSFVEVDQEASAYFKIMVASAIQSAFIFLVVVNHIVN